MFRFHNFTYFIKVFGCQMNHADALRIETLLENSNGKSVTDSQKADYIVVLSCGVRKGAEDRIISWMKKIKKTNESSEIVLTGCLSHREDIQKKLSGVVSHFVPIPEWGLFIKNFGHCEFSSFYSLKAKISPDFRAFVPISNGCNNFCSYCVVPHARGREISRPPEEILDEVKTLIKKGKKEIFLLGQNVNSYRGVSEKGKVWSFLDLLKKIDSFSEKFWLKFLSSHPKDVDEKFIKEYSRFKKVSSAFHLPIQSGSNKILRKMNRKYTREDYLEIVKKIRSLAPHISVSTDIIVGFPQETEKDFADSLDAIDKCQFEALFALKYSPRPGTEAYKMKDDVTNETKKNRQRKLDEHWKKIAQKKNKRFLGQEVIILVERIKETVIRRKTKKIILGKTFGEKSVTVTALKKIPENIVGKWVRVKIKKVTPIKLVGEFLRVEKEG